MASRSSGDRPSKSKGRQADKAGPVLPAVRGESESNHKFAESLDSAAIEMAFENADMSKQIKEFADTFKLDVDLVTALVGDFSASESIRHRLLSGKPLSFAEAIQKEIKKGAGPHSPLLLYGGVGYGKTHLMHAPSSPALPKTIYRDSPEAKRGSGGIAAYLERVWLPLMRANPGFLDLRTLREVDPSAAMAITKLKQRGSSLPEHLKVPTRREVNDRVLAEIEGDGLIPMKDADRLARARRRRSAGEVL